MVLGLLPAIRGGLGELARTGQHSRLIEGYIKRYLGTFEEVRYFSYLEETLAAHTDDAAVLARCRLLPSNGWHPWLYAFAMPFRHGTAFRTCAVLRVFQVTGTIPAVIVKRRFGVPFITTYGFWYTTLVRSAPRRRLRAAVERVGLAAADGVIVPTPALAAHVAARIGRDKVHLIPNGVDTEMFQPPRDGRAPGSAVALYVGRLSAEKDLGVLIEAVGRLAGRVPAQLTLVGEGPCRTAHETIAGRLGVTVHFAPFVEHHKLPPIYREAGAFVLPSRTEGHPKVLLEAMSSGLPCVASAVSGNLAILDDGETGLLFPPGDAQALADALARILTDPALGRKLGEQARRRVLERYDLGMLVGREIELLRRTGRPG